MKIGELIEVLKRRRARHGDIEVSVTWEGQTKEISPTNVYACKDGKELIIDADGNFYKEGWDGHAGFALDPTEGDDGL